MILKRTIYYILSLFFICNIIYGYNVPNNPVNYISDYSKVLSPREKQNLNNILHTFDKETTNQIFVAIIPSLKGEPIEDVSYDFFTKWKPGQKDKDNGILILIAIQNRKIRIEVGYGLESKITDAISKTIILHEIHPFFQEKKYYNGIYKATTKMMKIISGTIPKSELRNYVHRGKEQSPFAGIIKIILTIFILLFIIRHPFLALFFLSGTGFGSSGRSSGGFTGFSGGGGSFGGGGASGGW